MRQGLCGDASRLSLDHFSKYLSSVLGRTEICNEVRNPGPQKPQIICNENHHLHDTAPNLCGSVLAQFSVPRPRQSESRVKFSVFSQNFTKISRQISRHLWQRKTERNFTPHFCREAALTIRTEDWGGASENVLAQILRNFWLTFEFFTDTKLYRQKMSQVYGSFCSLNRLSLSLSRDVSNANPAASW